VAILVPVAGNFGQLYGESARDGARQQGQDVRLQVEAQRRDRNSATVGSRPPDPEAEFRHPPPVRPSREDQSSPRRDGKVGNQRLMWRE
jgi:hypothetical protein